tara:strand:+ start:3188 stop:3691 length:504 start_codon:yes stop_codon:yes gene_type:complete
MRVSLIVAASENNIIGKDNDLIWHLPKDMRFFKETTIGHHIIMGRKNFESIPHKFRPLPKRTNVVITRQKDYKASGCITLNSIEDALEIAKRNNDNEPFIIGGGQIYKIALDRNLIDRIYLTRIHHKFDGDTYFPELSDEWREINKIENKIDNKHKYNYDFIILERN